MDLLAQHEAFLRAIFDAPDEDTHRLVYADFLEENDQADLAKFIRLECASARSQDNQRELGRWAAINVEIAALKRANPPGWPWAGQPTERGFPECRAPMGETIELRCEDLSDTLALRQHVVRASPQWFGACRLSIRSRSVLLPEHIDIAYNLPFMRQITEWSFAGSIEETSPIVLESPDAFSAFSASMNIRPRISPRTIDVLVRHRWARRIESLDLRNNNLDNDAARALVASPYLDNLKRLQLLEGNRLRGKVWQQVIERFGEDVVG
jgi:uncharacterized protein (TIGR02996 family)